MNFGETISNNDLDVSHYLYNIERRVSNTSRKERKTLKRIQKKWCARVQSNNISSLCKPTWLFTVLSYAVFYHVRKKFYSILNISKSEFVRNRAEVCMFSPQIFLEIVHKFWDTSYLYKKF